MAATEQRLNELHEKVTGIFLELLDEGGVDLPPATLKTITSFLKENSITCQEDAQLDSLKERLEKKTLASVLSITPTQKDYANG